MTQDEIDESLGFADLPKPMECENCAGTGQVIDWSSGELELEKCEYCCGTGKDLR